MEVQWRQSITRLFAEMWKLISVSSTMRAFTLVHHNQSKLIMNIYILLKYILAVLTWQLSNITGLKSLSTIYEITKKLPYIFSFPTSSHILPEASSWRNFPSGVYLWFWSALEVGTQCFQLQWKMALGCLCPQQLCLYLGPNYSCREHPLSCHNHSETHTCTCTCTEKYKINNLKIIK